MGNQFLETEEEKARYIELTQQGYNPRQALDMIKLERIEARQRAATGDMMQQGALPASLADIDSTYRATRGGAQQRAQSIDSARAYHDSAYGGDMNRVPNNELLEYLDMIEKQRGGR